MKRQKKIVIFGPLNTRGGREIEAGFVGSILSKKYNVTICSTERIEAENDLLLVDKELNIYTKYSSRSPKVLKRFIKRFKNEDLKFQSLKLKTIKSLREILNDCDLIIVIAQVLSLHVESVVNYARKNNKNIVFRTTGKIPLLRREYNGVRYDLSYLEAVNSYIHHSIENAKSLKRVIYHEYEIIDQCVVNENSLISQRRERKKIKRFYTCSRLDKNKNVETVIKAFNKLCNLDVELHIYGEGYELERLKKISINKNTIFHGHIQHDILLESVNKNDCLIISSLEEAGPYTGLEAMCLGIPIISTKVGSMPKRLENLNNIWFKPLSVTSLLQRIMEFNNMDPKEIKTLQSYLIESYQTKYSKTIIEKKYIEAFSNYLV